MERGGNQGEGTPLGGGSPQGAVGACLVEKFFVSAFRETLVPFGDVLKLFRSLIYTL